MPRRESTRYAFNRGLISPLALARVDLKRTALSAEEQTNWMPRALGPMMLRPGWQHLGSTAGNAASRNIEFVRSITETHILEFTAGSMRVWTSDALLTRVAVSSAVANGGFDSNLTSWTDNDEVGGTSVWVAGGYMGLTGNGSAAAIQDQQITVIAADQNKEHALRIVVQRGPVTLRVGSTSGGDEYVNEIALGTGTHSLAFTPTGASFYIRLMSRLARQVLVNSCNVEPAGAVAITSPYQAADLDYIRAGTDSLSVDVMYVSCVGFQQRKIERRSSGRSWSLVLYQPDDGPFRSSNTGTQTMTPSVLTGNGTLTSSIPFFRTTHAPSANNGGALFKIVSNGQTVTRAIAAENTFTNAIRVTGVDAGRVFTVTVDEDAAGAATFTLQRSLDSATGPWTDVQQWTADVTTTYDDTLDNQIAWYRLGVKTGDYVNGNHTVTLSYTAGSITGVCRVTSYTSSTIVDMEVVVDLGGTAATDDWAEGKWSDYRGWPSAVCLYEGRLNWDGYDTIALSVSDAFESFDDTVEGDSGPIVRSIGSGPMDTINWALPLQRLVLGAQLGEHSVRSNAFDEPITPSNFNRKQASGNGSAPVQALRYDSKGMFVQQGGTRVFEVGFDGETFDYGAKDMTVLNPDLCPDATSISRMAGQRRPDTRFHFVLTDGTVRVLVRDSAENIMCWVKLTTSGFVEDVCVLPGGSGTFEDQVYYTVRRTINAATVRYIEKWALESQCQGATLNRQADAFVVAAGGSATLSGLTHLVGASVIVWANGKDLGTYTVSAAGQITVSETVGASGAVVGLGYSARFKSAKLGDTLSKHMNIDHIAPILRNTHAQGLEMGPDFDHMDYLPLMVNGAPADAASVHASYDHESQEFPGTWDVDARVCLRATAPRPCTVLAAVINGQVTD